jgi:hypothetical protein
MYSKKFPHLYEYHRRCRIISESDEEYYEKYRKEILEQEQEESAVESIRYFKLGGTKQIHCVNDN